MIREHGVDKVSWRSIARAVNYSPAGLYEYFENKDAIVAALAKEGEARLEDSLRAVSPSLLLEEQLIALGKVYIGYAYAHPDYFALVFSALPSVRRSLQEPAAGAYKQLYDLMKTGIDNSVFRSEAGFRAEEMAYSFWSLVHGMAILQLTTLRGFQADFDHVDEEGMKRFIEGLQT